LANILTAAGYEAWLYEDYADEVFDLTRRLATALDEGIGDAALFEAFNNEDVQNSVITYFKVSLLMDDRAKRGADMISVTHGSMDEDTCRELHRLHAWPDG
jgi:hypothetical protein